MEQGGQHAGDGPLVSNLELDQGRSPGEQGGDRADIWGCSFSPFTLDTQTQRLLLRRVDGQGPLGAGGEPAQILDVQHGGEVHVRQIREEVERAPWGARA